MYRRHVKRGLDILFSLLLSPFVLLICAVIAPFIFFDDHGSIFYKAKRRGLNGKIFEMYKLRSMTMNAPDIRNADNSTYNAPDDPRITKTGKMLRKLSIDELPQVFNILKGDMSFIGPRPVTIDKPLEEYDEKRRLRLTVRPGITGYQQAYYRNSIPQEQKFEMDAEYAQNVSFLFDLKILFKTIQTVLMRRNIYNTNIAEGEGK